MFIRAVLSGLCLLSSWVYAGEVAILEAKFVQDKHGDWNINVTLGHEDEGWEHYADLWRVVDQTGNVVARRVLHHPHVNEQPFTRGLKKVVIPQDTQILYVEAHDMLHGWAKQRLMVDLTKVQNGQLQIKR